MHVIKMDINTLLIISKVDIFTMMPRSNLKKSFKWLNVHFTAMELKQISDLKLVSDSTSVGKRGGKK